MPTPTLNRKQYEARRAKFEAWLVERGAELLTPTNEWELLRFRTEKGVGIIYTNKHGQLTWQGPAAEAYLASVNNAPWRAVPKEQRRARSSPTCLALRKRDGDACFYCHLPVAVEDESVEHLVPLTAGGADHIANMALAHRVCNREAGHLSLMEKIRFRETCQERLHTPGTLPALIFADGLRAAGYAAEAQPDETLPPWD
jgi:hypothetical protein